MRLFPDASETIEGTARAIREGRRTCADVLRGCLARIEEREPVVRAWAVVGVEAALARAEALDREIASGVYRGPLHGIPIGVKDVIDVAGLPTAAGFGPWAGRIAEDDAPLVSRLRAAGALILGKTVTTQFAWIDPPVTRNPWDPGRTPGGSSSGSAAAVASGMCLGAIGSQTGGSITRPASFCGVCGHKPAKGAVSEEGLVPLARSLDHPGPIARTIADLGLILTAIEEPRAGAHHSAAPDRVRLVRLRGMFEDDAEPPMREAFERAIGTLRQAGAEVSEAAPGFEEILGHHRTMLAAEAASWHEDLLRLHPSEYRPRIRALVEEGLALPATRYMRSAWARPRISAAFAREFAGAGLLVTPATLGPAPDPSTTGDPRFNSPWSYASLPTLSFPFALSPDGLPLALQLIDPSVPGEGDAEALFPAARWCEDVLRRDYESRSR